MLRLLSDWIGICTYWVLVGAMGLLMLGVFIALPLWGIFEFVDWVRSLPPAGPDDPNIYVPMLPGHGPYGGGY